ncbi:MAG TPA: aldehyde dehydrogenase family protein, partial [Usitatibacter sp.]|nr:aldehyde dehydrogenase family protein [Usitatibacter sp.]
MAIASPPRSGSTSSLERRLMLIDGQWVASRDGRFIAIENPANRKAFSEVPRAGEADVDLAVKAAAKAF